MTVDQVIDRVDRLKCNAYTLREKREWLAQLEGLIRANILDTHSPAVPGRDPEKLDGDWELTAPAPFQGLYIRWLEAQIDLYNGEPERYNGSIALFNAEYNAFESWYNRSHTPNNAGDWRH